MAKRCVDGGTEHNVQRVPDGIQPITQLWGHGEELDGRVIHFSPNVRRCVWCGLVYGYPCDPRDLPPANDRAISSGAREHRAAELELCEREQHPLPAHTPETIREFVRDVKEAYEYLEEEVYMDDCSWVDPQKCLDVGEIRRLVEDLYDAVGCLRNLVTP